MREPALLFILSLVTVGCGGRTGTFWPESSSDSSARDGAKQDLFQKDVQQDPRDGVNKDGPWVRKDGSGDDTWRPDMYHHPDSIYHPDWSSPFDAPHPPDFTPPKDHPIWPDLKPKDQWPQLQDGYAGAPFGCQNNSDCFGLQCCPTPWGVHLCLANCGF
jgi:hypothetical protein